MPEMKLLATTTAASIILFSLVAGTSAKGFSFRFPRKKGDAKDDTTSREDMGTTPADARTTLADAPAPTKDPFGGLFPFSFTIPPFVEQLSHQFVNVLLYKPPVGIVAVYSVTKLILSGRIFQMYPEPKAIEDILHKEASKTEGQKHRGRALYLDGDDQKYFSFGGIDRIRRRLCWAALLESESPMALTLIDALALATRPGGTRSQFLLDSIPALALLERQQFKDPIELLAYTTIQSRASDALLRVARDRLLKASYRLARSMEFWKKRIARDSSLGFMTSTQEGDRIRLSYAEAAYRAEVERLGRIGKMLMERPPEMEEKYLIQALKETEQQPEKSQTRNKLDPRSWSLPSLAKYSIRWNPYGKRSPISIRKFDDSTIDSSSAIKVLLSDPTRDHGIKSASKWSQDARKLVCQIVTETLEGSTETDDYNEPEFAGIAKEWGQYAYGPDTNVIVQWTKALMYTQNIARLRRVGEGSVLRIRDMLDANLPRKLNVFGVPSAIITIGLAYVIHDQVFPYWPQVKADFLKVFWKTLEVIQTRVWVPFKGIWDDLMNKKPGLMSGFTLDIEQSSLDHMLRDMGFGDGTEATRLEALRLAAAKYENDLKSGPLKSMIGGSLIRELLIQVQQLKVGVLTALETIDVLMQGNRIHFQILAAIPAILIATFGTRLFLRFLYNIRTRDLRPVTAVHGEMGEYLNKIEGLFLLSDRGDEKESNIIDLSVFELGEMLLHVHRYLLLMDFTSPPFPSWLCEQIHEGLRSFLGADGTIKRRMSQDRQMSWLHLVQRKHQELLKHL